MDFEKKLKALRRRRPRTAKQMTKLQSEYDALIAAMKHRLGDVQARIQELQE